MMALVTTIRESQGPSMWNEFGWWGFDADREDAPIIGKPRKQFVLSPSSSVLS